MNQLTSESTKLRVALTTRIKAIMRDSAATSVIKGKIVQSHLLNKARQRIGLELNHCLATADVRSDKNSSISNYEINRAALTIAHAVVNPYYVDWDASRFADMVKASTPSAGGSLSETERLQKYFAAAKIGKISAPATIVDREGNIVTIYLPNILSPFRVDCVNSATKALRNLLLRSIPSSSDKSSWRSQGFVMPEEGGEFGAGRITVSPAYFMQRHEVLVKSTCLAAFDTFWQQRLQDPMVTSASYKSVEVQEWLAALSTTEFFWNAITAASAPDLFKAGATAISRVVQELQESVKPVDIGGAPSLFDLLISLGSGHKAKLVLADVGAELDYYPGTMNFISGKVLQHSIGPWGEGERLVIAHFMKDKIHSRVAVSRPAFPTQAFFLKMVGQGDKGR
ncbi:uncharacterized protein EDB91DRAFT_1084601 [Suillus paluster]|uniref:uncharacterized protein n=1 Tax=Suillus paluster TaxID=48578 RepID=UPI001B8824A4|nr:uncharacterized protein EDB91DRAFT_1084601 [Suillus paluster]KAG1732856.1 hypothetical protein EDB91DRAFT_1084601 [Suillus paluster]